MTAHLSFIPVIETIADHVAAYSFPHTLRIGIDGRTAIGKTCFAAALAPALQGWERNVINATIDGFHHPKNRRYLLGRQSAVGYYRDARDLAAIRDLLLMPLGPEGTGRYTLQTYDLDHETTVRPLFKTAPADSVLILDGTFLQRRELRDHFDMVIYLDASATESRRRGLARDSERLGEDAEILYQNRYLAAFDIYLDEVSPVDTADIVVDVNDLTSPRITKLTI